MAVVGYLFSNVYICIHQTIILMKKLFLLDAYALIYRAYYAFLKVPRINSKGLNTSAIFGFLNTLQEVLREQQPTHCAVVFDPGGKTFRHEAYEQYKAQREETPEDIRKSVPIIKRLVEAYNIPVISVDGFEADDVIGTLANKASAEGMDVYMMTPDKDYGQLVGDHRYMFRPRFGGGFETLGEKEVLEKWGLKRVDQVIDLLGLMGDSSDNIPGCPGVGEKTAVKLLTEYDNIENLLANTESLKGAMKKKVEENREQIEFSKFLATIKTDVPVEYDEEALKVVEPDVPKLVDLFTELEFRKQLEKLTGAAPAAQSSQPDLFSAMGQSVPAPAPVASTLSSAESVEHQYICVDNNEKISELLKALSSSEEFCFDTETTSVDAINAELVGMSFAVKEHEAYYVPVSASRDEAMRLLGKFKSLFEDKNIRKIGQNMKYDILVLANYGIEVSNLYFDTMIAHYITNPELRHNMDYMAESLLGYRTIHIDSLIGTGKAQKSMRDVPVADVAEYAAEDADITLQLYNVLKREMVDEKGKLFFDIEMPLVKVLARMERNGVLIDDFALAQSSQVMSAELVKIEKEAKSLAGDEALNISSPKQVGELLFEKLKLVEKPRKTRTGQYVTDEETLQSLAGKHDIVDKILQYRGVKKLLSTYIDALPKLINAKTGKIHTSFNQTVTATGRLSSSNPNLQNIPIREEQGKEIRKAFIAEPGCVFLSADYSQVELRIMAHLSGDEHLVAAFKSDEDIHAATASHINHLPIEEVTKDMRRKAKTANFGIIYGISAFGLAERLGISRGEAKQLIDDYFASFPKVKEYIEQCKATARGNGYVETILHRRRYLPDILSHNANVRGFAERNAVNAPIQGSAADIIKIAMINIDRRMMELGLKSTMMLQVHDELNFNVPKDELDTMKNIVKEEMEGAFELSVPLRVDIGVGDNWLEAH